MVSEVLPSLPLYTLAGYILVEGGASTRLLRVYTALFGWMPGGLAITTAVGCAVFTRAGSGVTIVSMGGLLLPMLLKARLPGAVFDRADQRLGISGAAVPAEPAGDPVRHLREDGADRYAVRGRIPAGAADGGYGLGMGRASGRPERRGQAAVLLGGSSAGALGGQMGTGGAGDRDRGPVKRIRHHGGSGRHCRGLFVHC